MRACSVTVAVCPACSRPSPSTVAAPAAIVTGSAYEPRAAVAPVSVNPAGGVIRTEPSCLLWDQSSPTSCVSVIVVAADVPAASAVGATATRYVGPLEPPPWATTGLARATVAATTARTSVRAARETGRRLGMETPRRSAGGKHTESSAHPRYVRARLPA